MIEVAEMERRRQVLARLQAEAMQVFAGSGETVETFLRERREEARREDHPPLVMVRDLAEFSPLGSQYR